jgi:hypothetical protein
MSLEDEGTPSAENEESKQICVVGRDLTEFSVVRFGSFIQRIDLSFNFLTKVKGLHVCAETLEELSLDNNQLEQIELKTVFPKLHTLSLNKNRIWDLRKLLKELTSRAYNLRYLSLLGNPVCPDQLSNDFASESDYQTYRCVILFHLSSLRFLDHRIVTPKELKKSQDPTYSNSKVIPLTPLPLTLDATKLKTEEEKKTQNGDKKLKSGKQGKRRFRYVGKNSEGNRFIKDSDL